MIFMISGMNLAPRIQVKQSTHNQHNQRFHEDEEAPRKLSFIRD